LQIVSFRLHISIFMKRFSIFYSVLFFLSLSVFAQIPSGYYNSAIGKKQAELKTALHLIVMNATPPSYGSGASSTWGAFTKTDIRPEDGTVWDMYTDNHVAFSGTSAASGMNIEHSLANSWWGGIKGQTYNDLFNLNPSNSSANSSKGSWPIAVVDGTTSYSNGVIKVGKSSSRPGGTIDAWEPADEYKGDFARSYMYMVTSYEDFSTKWTGNSVNQLDNNTYPVFEQWTVDLFLKWNAQDPVSAKEISRNNEVYKIQGNRNPYIDYPLLAEYVWGKLMTVPFTTDGNVDFSNLSSPTNATVVDFGKVVYQRVDTASVYIKASKLTGDLSLAITGTNAANFSVTNSTISKVDAEAGYKLILNYTAQTIGNQTAQLTISGGGINAVTLSLKALSSDEFMALSATNITNNGFTVNWTSSAAATGYSLNVFTMQSSGNTTTTTLIEDEFTSLSAWTTTGYTSLTDLSGNVRLASSSTGTYGAITSSVLNLSTATTLLVRAKQFNSDAGAKLTVKVNNDSITSFTTSTTNQDFTVNIPAKTATSTITLSAVKSARVYVDYLKLTTQGSIQTPVSVTGYPTSVGNVLTSTVESLSPNTNYYYTLTPQGNAAVVSNQIQVTTLLNDAVKTTENLNLSWTILNDGILIRNYPANCTLTLLNVVGRRIQGIKLSASEIKLKLDSRGIYLLQIQQGSKFSTYKVMF